MSRGLGRIEQNIFKIIESNSSSIESTYIIAKTIWERKSIKYRRRFLTELDPSDLVRPSEINSVHRALASLHRKGLVYKTGRRAFGEIYWGNEAVILKHFLTMEEFIPHSGVEMFNINPLLLRHIVSPNMSDAQFRLNKLLAS